MQQSLSDFLEMILGEKCLSLKTADAYKRDINQFISSTKIKNITQITPEKITEFINFLNKKHLASSTQARKLSAIREFCKFLCKEKKLQPNPSQNIDNPKTEKPLPKFLTSTEIQRLINKSKEQTDFNHCMLSTMLILMYHCGLRVSELISLPINGIHYDKRQIKIKGKGAKERIVPISEFAIKEILEYSKIRDFYIKEKNNNWLFPSIRNKGKPITRDAFFKQLKKLAINAGIYPSRVSPHVLRHSFATQLLRHNADLRSVQKMLGHESITTTEIYTHIISDELIEKIQRLHPLGKK